MRAVCSPSIRRSARSPWLTVSRARRKSKMDSRRTASHRTVPPPPPPPTPTPPPPLSPSPNCISRREDARPRPASSRPACLSFAGSSNRPCHRGAGIYLYAIRRVSIVANRRTESRAPRLRDPRRANPTPRRRDVAPPASRPLRVVEPTRRKVIEESRDVAETRGTAASQNNRSRDDPASPSRRVLTAHSNLAEARYVSRANTSRVSIGALGENRRMPGIVTDRLIRVRSCRGYAVSDRRS